MGKHLVAKHPKVHLDDNSPGCQWGIFQVLYYHHWRHVKKMFSHKKHHEAKHARYTRKKILFNHYCDESQESEDAEAKFTSNKIKSPKKNQDMLKKEDYKCKMSSPTAGKQLHPLCQKHGLEPPDNCFDCLSNFGNKDDDSANQRHYLFLPKAPEESVDDGKSGLYSTNATDKLTYDHPARNAVLTVGENKHTTDISNKMEYSDVLEVIKSKKDMFLKILQDLDLNKKPSYSLQASNSRAKLMKSDSFPAAKSYVPDTKLISISTLKHKQTEIWAFPKVEELSIASQEQEHVKPVPSPTDDRVAGSGMKGKTQKFSSGTSVESNQQSWNQLVVHRFKIMKKKIKHALTEFKKDKDSKQNPAETINQKISTEEQEIVQPVILNNEDCREYVDNCQDSYETWDTDRSEQNPSMVRRTTSLKESLDRYTNLFEKSFGKDKKWQNSKSKSLKLTNEDKFRISRSTSMSYGRNLSLPNHIFLYEASYDSQNSSMPGQISEDTDMKSEKLSFNTDEQYVVEEARLENENVQSRHSNMSFSAPYDLAMVEHNEDNAEASEFWYDKHLKVELTSSCQQANKETECTTDPCRDLTDQAQEAVTLDDEHQDHITCFMEASLAVCSSTAEPGCSIDVPKTQSIHSILDSTYERTDDIQPSYKYQLCHFLRPEFDMDDSLDLRYVEYILECLGIVADELSGTSNFTEDLLSESMSKDFEAILANEFQSSGDYIAYLHHWLLFDLLKEVLIHMRETSSTYFPMPFSFNCRARPIPKGNHLLQEAWKGINSYLSLRPELDKSLDDVVGRDLAKGTWANLQLETECMTFELEDMILEELLDEVICSRGC